MVNATRRWFVRVLRRGALAAVMLGCGGSQAAAPAANTANEARTDAPRNAVNKRGAGSVAATLGPGGGALELEEGPRVEVPRGALDAGQEFVLRLAQKTTAFLNRESERALGPTFSFSPELDATAGGKLKISFPLASLPEGWGDPALAYETASGDVVGGEDSTRTQWQYERAALSGGRVLAQVAGVTGLRMQFVLTNLEAQ